MEQDAVPAGSASSAGFSGPFGLRPTGTKTRARGARWTVSRQIVRAGNSQARPGVKKDRSGAPRGATFLIAKGGGALRTRAGVLATPRGFASPASLGASLPLISRAHRAAATRTAACRFRSFRRGGGVKRSPRGFWISRRVGTARSAPLPPYMMLTASGWATTARSPETR